MVSISCLCEVRKGHFENRPGAPFLPALLLFFRPNGSTSPPMLHYMLFMDELMREIHILAHLGSLLLENTVLHPFNLVLENSAIKMLQPYHARAHSVLPFFQPWFLRRTAKISAFLLFDSGLAIRLAVHFWHKLHAEETWSNH